MIQIDKPFDRESGPWPFPNTITEYICLCAGREASAALFIAIGPWANGGIVARKATYCEPFTYWDWHGVRPDERFNGTPGLKRQQTWERQRGYRREGRDGEFGYLSPRARWEAFKTSIQIHPQRRLWVQRIAVAHWMEGGDLDWIARHLSKLQGLDLSDTLIKRTRRDTGPSSNGSKGASLPNEKITELLGRIKWLGLPDVRAPGLEYMEIFPLTQYLSMCNVLQTLCIRDTHSGNMRPYLFESAKAASAWITETITDIPATTTVLELRICQPSIDRLVAELVKGKSRITHIGIDLGAWAQTHLPTTEQLHQEEIRKSVAAAACKTTFDAYEEEHNKVFPMGSKWWLPNFLPADEGHTGQDHQADRPAFARYIYHDNHIAEVNGGGALASRVQISGSGNGKKVPTSINHGPDRLNLPSIYENLLKLYKTGAGKGHGNVQFFSLTLEWQVNSTDPIHPMAMIRPESEGKLIPIGQLRNMYDWLNKTFNWRPVFDWDYFIKLDSPDGQDALITQIAQQFQHMRYAHIPIRLLIGRRHSDLSSLYWGCDSAAWTQALSKPFNHSLDRIAALVDALIIHYDLRNPLDHDRLEEIDKKEPSVGPAAVCPRALCPWKRKDCPFEKQWDQKPVATNTQTAANGSGMTASNLRRAPKHPPRLASSDIPFLPTGEDASLHPSDDYDPASAQGEQTLHQLARHAAYLREAVGWQRFWSEYSPKLTNLSELHVRMPRSFDKVGSLRLRKLLDPREGWEMHTFTEERQHMQTHEDLEWSVGNRNAGLTHLPENKIRPGGRFVRRLWVRKDAPPSFKVATLEQAAEDVHDPGRRVGNSVFDNVSEEEIERIEREELERAIRAAKVAARREQEHQKSLEAARESQALVINSDQTSGDTGTANTGTQRVTIPRGPSAEERRNRMIARQAWLVDMHDHAHNLNEQNIETVIQHDLHRSSNDIKTIASDAVQIREVLRNTRTELERRGLLFPDGVFQGIDTLASLEDLAKELAEKRARPMAKQVLEHEARIAAAQAKAEAQLITAALVSSSTNNSISDLLVSGGSEIEQTDREIPETQPLPDDYVFDDTPGDGFVPKHLLDQSSESVDDSDLDSLFDESPEPASPMDPPAPPLNATLQTVEADSPIDLEDDNFWDDTDENGRGAVSRFPDEIPETSDDETSDTTTPTTAIPVTALGSSVLGTPRVQADVQAAPVMVTAHAAEVTTIEAAIVTEQATAMRHQNVTIEHTTTQIAPPVSAAEPPDTDAIIDTTEIPESTDMMCGNQPSPGIQDSQPSPEIPETPELPDPTPTPQPGSLPTTPPPRKRKPPKQAPRRAPTPPARTLLLAVPEPDDEPAKPAKKRTRTRAARSATPALGSRHSTRSVTPRASYVEVESDEDGERGRKKRGVGKRGKGVGRKGDRGWKARRGA